MARKTLEVFGMTLPIMAELEEGFFLVAHPNGPAIANENLICAIHVGDEGIRESIRSQAIDRYVAWTWGEVKGLFL